jgi:hypothetical protein
MRALIVLPLLAALSGCTLPPRGNPEFDDATSFAFLQFDVESQADIAYALRALEKQLYLSVDLDVESANDRALSPAALTDEQLEGLERPDRPAANLRAVTVIKGSEHAPQEHRAYIQLADQLPVEPSSQQFYDRTLVEGADCWDTKGCEFLRTENDLTKDNILINVRYTLFKDYRWVDMNLPDPDTVVEGEEPVNDGPKRWAIAGRSWTKQEWPTDDESKWIRQSYSIEVWLPRDGGGYVRAAGDENLNEGTWTHDSTGGGALRMLTLWGENDLGFDIDEATEVRTIQNGIDDIFDAQDGWLSGQ